MSTFTELLAAYLVASTNYKDQKMITTQLFNEAKPGAISRDLAGRIRVQIERETTAQKASQEALDNILKLLPSA